MKLVSGRGSPVAMAACVLFLLAVPVQSGGATPARPLLQATATIASAGGDTYLITLTNTDPSEAITRWAFVPTTGTVRNVRPSPTCQGDSSVLCTKPVPSGTSMQVCFDDAQLPPSNAQFTLIEIRNAANAAKTLRPTVVAAVAGCPVSNPPTVRCVVPKLAGKTLAAAKRALSRAHCGVGKITKKRSKAKHGRVIAQSPKAGTKLPSGSKVKLVVSKGR
jgi:hypothetical protein